MTFFVMFADDVNGQFVFVYVRSIGFMKSCPYLYRASLYRMDNTSGTYSSINVSWNFENSVVWIVETRIFSLPLGFTESHQRCQMNFRLHRQARGVMSPKLSFHSQFSRMKA